MDTTIHFYYFDLRKEQDAKDYKTLCHTLRAVKLKPFDAWGDRHYKNIANEPITLETECLFDNQWNTAPTENEKQGLRVFDWGESRYPNRSIRKGHYLSQTQEMIDIRNNTTKCGFCGKQYTDQAQLFCNSCFESPYLEEKDLPLLRLLPISKSSGNRSALSKKEKEELLPKMKAGFLAGQKKLKAKKLISQKADVIKEMKQAAQEAKYKLWLLNQKITLDNVIYYTHTKIMTFGWSKPITKEYGNELRKVLFSAPFDWELKEEK
jgi:hypothetical protein